MTAHHFTFPKAPRRLATAMTAIAAMLCLLPAACHRAPDDSAVVVSAAGGPATAANPDKGQMRFAQQVLMDATAQGLVRFDANGSVEPGLAERWIVIDGGLSYIFRLNDAEWADGSPVTAAEVAKAINRAIAANSRNSLAPYLTAIDEAVEMTPQVIELRLSSPRPDLLRLLAQPEMAIFQVRTLAGSGPFRVIADKRPGMLLRPVDDEDPQADDEEDRTARRDHDIRLFGERMSEALARYAAGKSDLVLGGTYQNWPVLMVSGVAPQSAQIDPVSGLFGLNVISRKGFLADAANREAVAMAIDRKALLAQFQSNWSPAFTILPGQLDAAQPPALPQWAGQSIADRRTAAAARVASWRKAHGDADLTIRVAMPATPGANLVWRQIVPALYAIGLRPVRVDDDAAADLRLIDQVAPTDTARWYLANACALCSDDAAKAIEAARAAPTLDERRQRLAEANTALTADIAYIPIAQPLRWSLVSSRLDQWQANDRAWHPLNHLRNDTK